MTTNNATSIMLTGQGLPETAKALVGRLIELGYNAEYVSPAVAERLGGEPGAALACRLLARNGCFAVCHELAPEGDRFEWEVGPHDTPDFAAEKALDALADAGHIEVHDVSYTPEEEERVRKRLADLGYIE